MATMLLSGLWHGAGANFVLWGGLHGLYSCVHTEFARAVDTGRFGWWARIPKPVRVLGFFHLMVLTWVVFRVRSLAECGPLFERLVAGDWTSAAVTTSWVALLSAAAGVHYLCEPWLERGLRLAGKAPSFVIAVSYMFLFGLLYWLAERNISHQAFIYFQF